MSLATVVTETRYKKKVLELDIFFRCQYNMTCFVFIFVCGMERGCADTLQPGLNPDYYRISDNNCC